MNEGEREEELRAAVDATLGKRRERKSAAAIVEPDAEVHPEAPLLTGPGSSGENADCKSCRLKAVIEKKNEEEQGEEDAVETSFEAVVQPESTIKSGLLPWLLTNNSVSDELKDPPRTTDESGSSIWHNLSTWWKRDQRKKHTINWTEIEIDVCPPSDFVEEPWQLSSPDFLEEPWQDSPPEHHDSELEAPPSPIRDYSSSGWFTPPTWWRKEKRERRTLTPADVDACPPPGYIEVSGIFWPPEHESDDPPTEELTVLSNSKPVVDLAETIDQELGDSEGSVVILALSSAPVSIAPW